MPGLGNKGENNFNRANDFIQGHAKPVTLLWEFNLLVLTFKAMHGLVPSYLTDKVTRSVEIHHHFTRFSSGNTLRVIMNKNKFWQRTFQYQAPKAWNTLPENIRKLNSLLMYKSNLKIHFNL